MLKKKQYERHPITKRIALKFTVIFQKEDDTIVAYCPTLDLSTCGKNMAEAQKRFESAVRLFMENL